MFNQIIKILQSILILLILLLKMVNANANSNLNLDYQAVNLPDALYTLTRFLNINAVISKNIVGVVTLHLNNANAQQVLKMLMKAHGLAQYKIGNLLLIAPQGELIKQTQNEMKWEELMEETSVLTDQTWHLNYANAQTVASLLMDEHGSLMSKRGKIRVDARTNTLYIQDSESQIKMITKLIGTLDVPIKQIKIVAKLASIDQDCEREIGINFGMRQKDSDNEMNKKDLKYYRLAILKMGEESLLDVKLSALENAGHAELISNPSLFTTNLESASIEAGEEVPYQEVSEGGGTAVVFKKAVLSLRVTPQILSNQQIFLHIEINQDRPTSRMIQGAPTISTRQIKTNVLIPNGETIVLGGIYESNIENSDQGLPFISQLPGIGLLFKKHNARQTKRELLIFITPNIIANL